MNSKKKTATKVVGNDNDDKGDAEGQYVVNDVGYKKIICYVRGQRSGVTGSRT